VIGPGEQVSFNVRYLPTTRGTPEKATIRISSNDPGAPFVDLDATGFQPTGIVSTGRSAIW